MDKILIEDLHLDCVIGTNDNERSKKQPLIIDISLWADLSQAGLSDNLGDTLDYSKIYNKIVQLVENSNFHLLESLSTSIAKLCLSFNMVQKVRVKIQKPNALPKAKSVSVEITSTR